MTDNQQSKQRPVESIQFGYVEASIWRNQGKNGVFHNVTVQRKYIDDGGKMRGTGSYPGRDLLNLSKVADLAHTRVAELDDQYRSKPDSNPDTGPELDSDSAIDPESEVELEPANDEVIA